MIFRRIAAAACGLAVLSCMLACGAVTKVNQAKQRALTGNELKLIALAYHAYIDDNRGKPPGSADDLAKWAQAKMPEAVPVINQAGPGGKYVFYWNVRVLNLPDGATFTVLGYEANAPSQGGMVAMADGAVMHHTAAEFAALKKPPKDGEKKDGTK